MTEPILALDVDELAKAERLVGQVSGSIRFFKIGLQLYTAHGPKAVDLVRRRGGKVFLDLKLHDIPQTVALAVKAAQGLGVDALSLHLSGGAAMIRAAADVSPRPKLWGVTVLTSLASADLRAVHPGASVAPTARRLAKLGLGKGADGIICSAEDVPALRKALKGDPCFITPGIRPAGSDAGDQKRVATPAEAAKRGIRYIVVGRPITHAADPAAAARAIAAELEDAAEPAGKK